MSNQRYPLDWPIGTKRSPLGSYKPKPLFKSVTLTVAVDLIESEVRKLKGVNSLGETDLIISTNVPLRNDGYPRADYQRSVITDSGVAVYFKHDREDVVLCCDKWRTIEDNLKAIAVTIEDMRRIERNGVSDFIKRSFQGFKQLSSASRPWWVIFNWPQIPNPTPGNYDVVRASYRTMARLSHPDNGGNQTRMQEINAAWSEAEKYFKNAN